MEHQGDVGLVESCFGLFGDVVSAGARYVHGLRQSYHRLSLRHMYLRLRNHFG
jgi:hypothetical protein